MINLLQRKYVIFPDHHVTLTHTFRENREYQVYRKLLAAIPGLRSRILASETDDELLHVADLVCIAAFLSSI
jgi:hypothetical protein